MEQPGGTRPRSAAVLERLSSFDPRSSLGARLALVSLPFLLVPVAVWGVLSVRLASRSERQLTAIVETEAIRQGRAELQRAADQRREDLEEKAWEALGVLSEAVQATGAALSAPAGLAGPKEELDDEAGRPYLARRREGSGAAVSRRYGLTPAALSDLAATRTLEGRFTGLMAGHRLISAIFVTTSSGVLRAVPWQDLSRLFATRSLPPDFAFTTRWPAVLPPGGTADRRRVEWTRPYLDVYLGRGQIVSALAPVYGPDGRLRAEVGIDFALEEFFRRGVLQADPEGTEYVFTRDGGVRAIYVSRPGEAEGGAAARRVEALAALVGAAGGDGPRDTTVDPDGEELLASFRPLTAVRWTYVRTLPVSAVRAAVVARLAPVFEKAHERRVRDAVLALALLPIVAAGVVLMTRRAVSPLRRAARYADAVAAGSAPEDLPEAGRRDEVGRLASALVALDRRVRRRIRSMQGAHDLAVGASLRTAPEETSARLARAAAELVGATKAFVYAWEPDSRRLVASRPGYGVADDRLRGLVLGPSDHGLAPLAFESGETFVSNAPFADPKVSLPLARLVGLDRNAVFVPLRTDAGPVGVLVVLDKPADLDEEDVAALETLADEGALLLRNARLFDELQGSYDRLRDANRNRDHFIQNVNHELRTPLTAILGWSEILAEDEPDRATVATAVEQIRRSAEFLQALISDLLDLSRVEEGLARIERAPADLGRLVRDAVEPAAVMAEGRGIALHVSAPGPSEVVVPLDGLRMRQVLWNLVHNAVKFTHKGGRIDVDARREADAVVLRVSDDGVGVDPADLPFIFDRFRQGDGSTTRAWRGTGIGLTLAKGYVELHGGTIGVESRPGRGTLFTVRIPVPGGPPAAGSAGPS